MRQLLLLVFLIPVCVSAQSTASKNVRRVTINAPQLKAERELFIYLPQDYETSTKKYPVVYMPDAQNLFDAQTSYAGEWRVDETLDSIRAQVIVVGIAHGHDKRIEALTPYPNTEYGGGKADAYLDFLINTVKPYIDDTYRTKKCRKSTYIFGSSLGGLTSYYALLKYPDVFGGAGVFSPSFWYTDDIYELTENTKKIKGKIYFMAGGSESDSMVPDMDRMILVLKDKTKSRRLKSKVVPGGKHNEALWSREFAAAYLWLLNSE